MADDPIDDAERQMVEHELDTVGELMAMAWDRLPKDREFTAAEARAALHELIADDPRARELAKGIAAKRQIERGDA
jgi:hypothetical protein